MSTQAHQSPLWMPVLITVAILFSFALACGMPFAGLAAIAAITLAPRNAFVLSALGWLANQIIGFGFLGYPLDAMTFAWGAALGLSALTATGAATFILNKTNNAAKLLQWGSAFMAAWVAQQATVFAASLVLGGTATAFAPSVVWFIFWTNALAFFVLLAAQQLGARAGVARPLLA
ncbi:MAG: hypothetical protein AAGI92_08135 [Pseudomonadota bacterium]